MNLPFLTLTTISLLCPLYESTIVLKPSKVHPMQAGLIFVQGAEIPSANYVNFSTLLQAKFNGSLWVAILEFPLNMPDPLQIASLVNKALVDLKSSGFSYFSATPFFFGGHSLGGVVLLSYLVNNYSSFSSKFRFSGTILEGSFVQKANLNKTRADSFPPVLTLGAELDGLARLTRITQAFYYDNNDSQQFVGSGKPTGTIIRNDIKAEIETSEAQERVTGLIASFMSLTLSRDIEDDRKLIEAYRNSTVELISPLIEGLQNEGFYDFKPPCYMQPQLKPPQCWLSSPWSPFAQTLMGSIDPTRMNITDTFRPAAKIPEQFPSLTSNCSSKTTTSECIVSILTYTENSYSLEEDLDNGFWPVAAIDARTKMASRQHVLEAYTGKKLDFNQTDGGNLCAQINKETIKWALSKAPAKTLKRYSDHGKQLVVGDDIDYSTGFTWLYTHLEYNEKVDTNNRTYIDLRSPTLRFATDYKIKVVAGLHYCKVLTTARALEWIYIDSVKP